MSREEVFVGSLTTKPGDNLSLTRVLEAEAIRGKITEVHAVLGEKQDGYDILSQVADIAFDCKIEPADVKTNSFSIEPSDHFFAEEFGYVILPIACAKLTKENKVEAWIAPAFVSKKHPLISGALNNDSAVVITTEKDHQETISLSPHYVRLTVKDDPGVLAKIAQQFGDANISIRMVRQPEVEEGSKTAQIAFILHPCDTKALEKCVASIQNLDVCLEVGSVLRVVE